MFRILQLRRRWSIALPPDLSDLINKLIEYANSFIKEFDNSEAKMREIVGEFQKIVDEVKKMQERTDTVRTTGAVTGGVGIGLLALGILAAPFTGGASLAIAGAAAGTAAAAGGVTVVGANVTKVMKENGSAKKVEKLGKEFMKIIEPLKKNLEEIKRMCDKLEEKSGEVQAGKTLTDVEEFQGILRGVAQLRTKSEGAVTVAVAVKQMIDDLLVLLVKVFTVTASPEEDQKFRASIIQSGDQCQKVVDQFDQMKKELKDFIGN